MSKLFEGCLLVSDIDGTLVSSDILHPDNVKMIKQFESDGGKFILASGRSAEALYVLEEHLGKLPVSIVCNGAVIYDFENKCALFEQPIVNVDKLYIKAAMERFPNIAIAVHGDNIVYALIDGEILRENVEYEKLTCVFCGFEEAKDKQWYKVVFMLNDLKEADGLIKLGKEFGLESSYLEPSKCLMNGKVQNFMEVHPNGVSKANALQKFIQYNNLQNGKVFAIGDYFNDVSMLKLADVSAAVKEAPDEVKACADYTAVGCKDGAVADFIGYLYSLKKKGCI